MIRRTSMTSAIGRLWSPLTSLTARNAASGFIALAWLSLLSMLTIPIYIRLLGVSEWGLVAACASLQVASNFIDAGLSQIVPRWVAKEAHHWGRLQQYVALFLRLYVSLGLLMFLLLQAAAGYLAHEWFRVPDHRADALELAIRIISFQFLFQFINNLHTGLWHGLQRQVLSNVRACGFGTLKHAVALTALMMGPPQVWLYALAFATVALLEVCINAITVRHMLGKSSADETDNTVALSPLLKEVSLMSGGVLVGLLGSQLDRIVLSRTVDVESFGIYTVIATLALAFLQLQTPVTRAYFPVIVHDIRIHGRVASMHMKRLLVGTIIACTLPSLLTCVFASQILSLWLRDPHVVVVGTAPLQLLLLAIALNSLYGCVYQVIIAKGQARRVLQFNLVSLAVATAVIFLMSTTASIMLGSAIWVAIASTQLLLGAIWFLKNR